MSGNKKYYNLKNATLKEFKDFFFDHEVDDSKSFWFYDYRIEIEYDPTLNARLFIEMFQTSEQLLNEYSKEKLEQGFWAIQMPNLEGSVFDLLGGISLGEHILPIEVVENLVRSMYDLFANLFQKDALLETACYMWWDNLTLRFQLEDMHSPNIKDDDKRLQDVIFETLTKILYLDSEDCKLSATHGLGHLHHPNTEKVIHKFLDDHPELDISIRGSAIASIDGNIL